MTGSLVTVSLSHAEALFTTAEHGDVREPAPRRALGDPLRVRQVHGRRVVRVSQAPDEPGEPLAEADGLATALPAVRLMVQTADCLPVVLATPAAVAVVHAGWRGLAAGVVEEGVRAVRELGGDGPLEAAIGPAAGPCCYEVGDEVRAALGAEGSPRTLDLGAIAERRLRRAGASAIQRLGTCTICDRRWPSHRRDGEAAGRMAGVAWRS